MKSSTFSVWSQTQKEYHHFSTRHYANPLLKIRAWSFGYMMGFAIQHLTRCSIYTLNIIEVHESKNYEDPIKIHKVLLHRQNIDYMSSYGPEFITHHFSQKHQHFRCFAGSFDRWATTDAAREHGTSRERPVDSNFGIHGGGKKDLGRSNRWGGEKLNRRFSGEVMMENLPRLMIDDSCVLMRVWWFRCSENWSSPLFAPLIAARVLWGVCFRQLGAVQGMLRSPNQICLDLGKFRVNELLRCQEESITYQPKLGWNLMAKMAKGVKVVCSLSRD